MIYVEIRLPWDGWFVIRRSHGDGFIVLGFDGSRKRGWYEITLMHIEFYLEI